MATKPVTKFVRQLNESQLLTPAQLEEVQKLPSAQGDNFNALAKDIYKKGWLTRFQLNEIANGRGRDLTIGSYRLLDLVGQGGMGQVFKAFHEPMGRVVALKVIRKERLGNENAVKRFDREIRTAAQLTHPNIVVAYDAGHFGSKIYYAMEYLDGIDLAALLAKSGPLPVSQACDFIRQAALGLQYAHECGMVHRDIKPHNLVATRLPTGDAAGKKQESRGAVVKILDLGLARLKTTDEDATVTQDNQGLGTPAYLAPEQARNAKSVDIRADIYSLGCTFYHLLTGHPPFKGEIAEVLLKHQTEDPPPVESLRPDVPPGVAAVVRKMIAKKADDRFQTPKAVADALAGAIRSTSGKGSAQQGSDLNWTTLLDGGSDSDTPSSSDLLPAKKTATPGRLATFTGFGGDSNIRLLAVMGLGGILILVSVILGIRYYLTPKTDGPPVIAKISNPDKGSESANPGAPKKTEADPIGTRPVGASTQILDDGKPGFTTQGKWTQAANNKFYGGTALSAVKSDGKQQATAQWVFNKLPRGVYQVQVTYSEQKELSRHAPFSVLDGDVLVERRVVNQVKPPEDDHDADGRLWQNLGEIYLLTDTLKVRLTSVNDGSVQADAVRITRTKDLPDTAAVQVLYDSGVVSSGSGTPVDFGRLVLGKAGVKEFIIRNASGKTPLELKAPITSTKEVVAKLSSQSAIAPGESAKLEVRLEALTMGDQGGYVSFGTNDPNPNSNPFTFEITGKVIAGP